MKKQAELDIIDLLIEKIDELDAVTKAGAPEHIRHFNYGFCSALLCSIIRFNSLSIEEIEELRSRLKQAFKGEL